MEEEEQNRKRAANRTALEAIGGPRKKRKLDEALESLQNAQTPGNTNAPSSTSSSNSSTNQVKLSLVIFRNKLQLTLCAGGIITRIIFFCP